MKHSHKYTYSTLYINYFKTSRNYLSYVPIIIYRYQINLNIRPVIRTSKRNPDSIVGDDHSLLSR